MVLQIKKLTAVTTKMKKRTLWRLEWPWSDVDYEIDCPGHSRGRLLQNSTGAVQKLQGSKWRVQMEDDVIFSNEHQRNYLADRQCWGNFSSILHSVHGWWRTLESSQQVISAVQQRARTCVHACLTTEKTCFSCLSFECVFLLLHREEPFHTLRRALNVTILTKLIAGQARTGSQSRWHKSHGLLAKTK